jgi:hypothetical protein
MDVLQVSRTLLPMQGRVELLLERAQASNLPLLPYIIIE